MLASENAACLSMRLSEKADQLRSLCDNAKTWEGDIKRAGQNLRRRLEHAQRPKKVTIETPKITGKIFDWIFFNFFFYWGLRKSFCLIWWK